jgi:hypothetical protein
VPLQPGDCCQVGYNRHRSQSRFMLMLNGFHPYYLQFYILQDSAKAESSAWTGLMHLTFKNDKGEEVTRSVPTNGTANYAALSSNTVSSYYCQRLPPGLTSCAQLKPYEPSLNSTCESAGPSIADCMSALNVI